MVLRAVYLHMAGGAVGEPRVQIMETRQVRRQAVENRAVALETKLPYLIPLHHLGISRSVAVVASRTTFGRDR